MQGLPLGGLLGVDLEDIKERYTSLTPNQQVKSPIAAIQGASELLEEEMPVEQRKKFLKNIRMETQRSTEIIDGLLKLSRLEAKDELIRLVEIPVKPLLYEAADFVKTRLETKSIKLEILCEEALSLKGDTMMLETAIVNLLDNAIEFAPQHSTISLDATVKDDQIRIAVTDQGSGLADFVKQRAFEHFFSLREHGKGSGLGLVFVKEVANLHSGEASIENHPEGGAIASITIPRA